MSGQLDRKLGHDVLRRRGLPFLMSSSVAVDSHHFDSPPVAYGWVIKDLGVSSRVCVTG